jgi:hypothetical protein
VIARDATFLELAQFLDGRLAQGDHGKTFLVGGSRGAWVFALAAGLRDDSDRTRFLEFARYLVHQRFACGGCALLWPADLGGDPVYVAELASPEEAVARVIDRHGETRPHPGGQLLVEDILALYTPLPGIRRREMDRLFEALQVPV